MDTFFYTDDDGVDNGSDSCPVLSLSDTSKTECRERRNSGMYSLSIKLNHEQTKFLSVLF